MISTLFILIFIKLSQSGSGFHIDESNSKYTKNSDCPMPMCNDCSSNKNNCESCQIGTFKDTDPSSSTYLKCIYCPLFCDTCYNETHCKTCERGAGLDKNGKCHMCQDPKCSICGDDYTFCLECKRFPGLSLYNGKCSYQCIDPGCDSCDRLNGSKCYSCKIGHLVGDKCVKCSIPNCESCNIDDTECISCNEHYYLENGECKAFNIPNCKYAKYYADSDELICKQCDDKYVLDPYDINKCVTEIPHCIEYENRTHCKQCDNYYGLSPDGKCLECPKNCYSCNSDYKKCSQCNLLQLYLTPDGECVATNTAEHCDITGSASDKCYLCDDGYGLIGGKCFKCENDCSKCNGNISKCTACRHGFVKATDDDNKCIKCTTENCKECNPNYLSSCYACMNGYRLDDEEKCVKCSIDHCVDCLNDPHYCSKCQNGYGFELNKNGDTYGKCVPCYVAHCADCQSDIRLCYECFNGYVLQNYGSCTELNDIENDKDNNGNNNNSGNGSQNKGKGKLSKAAIIGIAVGCSAAVAIIVISVSVYCALHIKSPVSCSPD